MNKIELHIETYNNLKLCNYYMVIWINNICKVMLIRKDTFFEMLRKFDLKFSKKIKYETCSMRTIIFN